MLALYAAANLFDAPFLWGLNFGRFFPPIFTWVVLAIAAGLLVPAVNSRVSRMLDGLSQRIDARRSSRIGFLSIISIAILAAGLVFYSKTSLLGDATLRLNQIEDGDLFLPTEMLDFFVHAVAFRLLPETWNLDPARIYNIISALCGPVFVVGIFRLARYVQPGAWLAPFLLLLSSGITALFFGYIESYAIIAALLPFLALSALRAADGTGSRIKFICWFVVACLVHSIAAFIFYGGLVAVILAPLMRTRAEAGRISKILIILVTAGLVSAYTIRYLGWDVLQRNLLGPFGRVDYGLGIFTLHHLLNLVNWLVLAAAQLVFLLPFLPGRRNNSTPHAGDAVASVHRTALALWLIIPAVVFVFFFAPQLGGPRDWDLFSLPMFLLLTAGLIIWYAKKQRRLPGAVLAVIFLSLASTAGFVGANASVARSVNRFAEVIEVSRFKNHFLEYFNLCDHADRYPELADRRLEFAVKAWKEPPYRRNDSLRVLYFLHRALHYQGSPEQSIERLNLALEVDSTDLGTHLLLASYYLNHGSPQQQLAMAGELERLFPNEGKAMMYAGVVSLRLGDVPRSGALLDRAYQLDDGDVDIMINYSSYLYESGEYDRAVALLAKALAKNPDSFLANHNIALAFERLGQIGEARRYLDRADSLAASDSQRQMIRRFRNRLTRNARPSP